MARDEPYLLQLLPFDPLGSLTVREEFDGSSVDLMFVENLRLPGNLQGLTMGTDATRKPPWPHGVHERVKYALSLNVSGKPKVAQVSLHRLKYFFQEPGGPGRKCVRPVPFDVR